MIQALSARETLVRVAAERGESLTQLSVKVGRSRGYLSRFVTRERRVAYSRSSGGISRSCSSSTSGCSARAILGAGRVGVIHD